MPMFGRTPIWIATGLFLVALPIYGQDNAVSAQPAQAHSAPDVAGGPKTSGTTDPNYVIGPQDVVDISVWKEGELSRSVPVRPDGKISLPLLSDVQAAGLTPMQLAAQITTGLSQFMNNPQVTVIVEQINSQRVYILGEANRIGTYTLLPEMTVLQALSNAGGCSPFANTKKIYVIRQVNGKQVKFFFNYQAVVAGKRPEQNIVFQNGDTIYVP
jgi:polysaccharide export outer membrane protein